MGWRRGFPGGSRKAPRLCRRRSLVAHAGCPEDGDRARILWATLSNSFLSFAYFGKATGSTGSVQRLPLHAQVPASEAKLALPPNTATTFVVSFAELGGGWIAYTFDGDRSGLAMDHPQFGTITP